MARLSSNPDLDTDDGDPPPRARSRAFPWRWMFAALAFVAIAVTVVTAVTLLRRPPTSHLELRPSPNVLVAIRDLARLETVAYRMERVIELSDEQTRLGGLLSAHDAILLVASGDVIAGVDLSQLRPADVVTDWPHRSVHLMAPAPQIFSLVVDNEHTHVHSRTTDVLAHRNVDLESQARQAAESAMRSGALEAGILTRAQRSAEQSLRSLLTALGFEHVVIEFRPAILTRE